MHANDFMLSQAEYDPAGLVAATHASYLAIFELVLTRGTCTELILLQNSTRSLGM